MSGNVFLVLVVAAGAVYAGRYWERTRRAVADLQATRRRLPGMIRTANRMRFNLFLIFCVGLLVIYVVARYG